MKITASKHKLSGKIKVPGSKSHTIRALLLASLAEGTSYIKNPLPSADCKSAAKAIKEFGASVDFNENDCGNELMWTVQGAGEKAHLPANVVDVGNSGSTMYFFAPVAATFTGWSIFTGDESIRTRPVLHLVDALKQLGAESYVSRENCDAPPFLIKGPIKPGVLHTDGRLSQYISGFMMACAKLDGTLHIELTDPKETPYLTMTKLWLESVGIPVKISDDFKHIEVTGPKKIQAFSQTIPSDWEAVAFPLMAAILSDSEIEIENVDFSGSQGDSQIVEVLQSVGANIEVLDKGDSKSLLVKKGGYLSTRNLKENTLFVNISGWPDAICALACIACFVEGTVVLQDVGVCRKKETDRIKVMISELTKLGGNLVDGLSLSKDNPFYGDNLIIYGHSKNKSFMHGGEVESFDDHRVAMSLACLGLGLSENDKVIVNNAECCSVSFPKFFEVMNKVGASFQQAE